MSGTFINLPVGGGQGISSVATAADLPAVGAVGDVVLILDSGRLVYWNELASTWDNIDADISTISIADTASVDLSITLGILQANLKLSAAAAAADSFLASTSIPADGLKVQIPGSGVRNTVLTGLASASGVPAATDTFIQAEGKILGHIETQNQIVDDTNEPTGFVDRTSSEFLFDNATRTFTIQPKLPATEFRFWVRGVEFVKTTAQTIVIPDLYETSFIYFDANGDIQRLTSFDISLITQLAYVCNLIWHPTRKELVLLAEERHGCVMDSITHERLHRVSGTQWISGLTPGNFPATDVAGNGDVASGAQFSISDGVIADEDIFLSIVDGAPQELSTVAEIPVFYREGAAGEWNNNYTTYTFAVSTAYTVGMKVRPLTGDQRRVFTVTVAGTSAGAEPAWPATIGGTVVSGGATFQYTGNLQFAVKNFLTGPNFRAAWNQFTAGAWQQTEVTNGNYVLSHIYATNSTRHPIIGIQGQALYGSIAAARTGAVTEISNLVIAGLPFQEFTPIATVILQTNSGYTNLVHSRLRQVDSNGNWYIRWSGQALSPTAAPGDHGNLTGRDSANQHPILALTPKTDGVATIAGRIGEEFQINVPSLSTTGVGASGEWGDVGSQALTAGEWAVTGIVEIAENGAALTSAIEIGVSTTAGNSAPAYGDSARFTYMLIGSPKLPIPAVLLSLSAAATVYLKSKMTYTGGTPQHAGFARIRRYCK